MERSKKFFTDLMAKEHVPTMINPKPCGHLCCCAVAGCEEVMEVMEEGAWPTVSLSATVACVVVQEEAVSFYTRREAKLKEEYRKEKEKVHSKPLGMAFVTFHNEATAAM